MKEEFLNKSHYILLDIMSPTSLEKTVNGEGVNTSTTRPCGAVVYTGLQCYK